MNDIIIPAAYYDECYKAGITVPQEQEIRHKGKGKQYVVNRDELISSPLIQAAVEDYEHEQDPAARNFLMALQRQNVSTGIHIDAPAAKPITRKTTAIGDRRNLIVTITPEGELILRPAGRRKGISISLSAVYSIAVNAEARRLIADRKKARKAKRAERALEKAAAAINFKANPNSITL